MRAEDELSTRLRALANEARLTAEQLSLDAQLGKDTVGRWIRTTAMVPSLRNLAAVEAVLSMSLRRTVDLSPEREARRLALTDVRRHLRPSGGDDAGGDDQAVERQPSSGTVALPNDEPDGQAVPGAGGWAPARNRNFCGREDVLAELRARLTSATAGPYAHVLQGMGGVGKTQIAVEYTHRHLRSYDLIWWIDGSDSSRARSSMAALAPMLGLTDVETRRVEEVVRAVLDALRRGAPYERWLVVVDDADQPENIIELLPQGGSSGTSHLLVTTRDHRWADVGELLEVRELTRAESIVLLRQRVRSIHSDEANRLAEAVGDLPLALAQAAALLLDTGMSVDEYLDLLADQPRRVLAEISPSDYPRPVATVWSLDIERLKENMPQAWELLRGCAFFGPAPVGRELLRDSRWAVGETLREVLADPITFGRAVRELRRYALARVDDVEGTLHVHPIVQLLVRAEMGPDEALEASHDVHLVLADSDPDDPDDVDNWARYTELTAYIEPSDALTCTWPPVRQFCRNVLRYLLTTDNLDTCDAFALRASEQWDDDRDILSLAALRADLLWAQGKCQAAREMRNDLPARLGGWFGEQHPITLRARQGQGADLRAQGDFHAARDLDEELLWAHKHELGDEHPLTLAAVENLAVDFTLLGNYVRAYESGTQIHQDWLLLVGRDDDPRVAHALAVRARTLGIAGYYPTALVHGEVASGAFADLTRRRVLRRDHRWVLLHQRDLALTYVRMGQLDRGAALGEKVHQRFTSSLGEKHPETLGAAMNLANAYRELGRSEEADLLLEDTEAGYRDAFGPEHPFTRGCVIDLASAGRDLARLDEAVAGLAENLGASHPWTLIGSAIQALLLHERSDDGAATIGSATVKQLRDRLGPDHPHTLACSANLARAYRARGVRGAEEVAESTLERMRAVLPEGHPHINRMLAGDPIRVYFDAPWF